jgi:hypothetical protein
MIRVLMDWKIRKEDYLKYAVSSSIPLVPMTKSSTVMPLKMFEYFEKMKNNAQGHGWAPRVPTLHTSIPETFWESAPTYF